MIRAIRHRLLGLLEIAKSFLLYDEETAVAVDAGHSRWCARRIVDTLGEIGLRPGDLRLCILTHRHWDHSGGVRALKSLTGCEVAIHEGDADALGSVVDHQLRDGEVIPLLGGIRVIHVPGHTPGSICLLYGDSLIAGDALIGGRRGLKPPASIYCDDYEEALRSLERLRSLDFKAVYVSHGVDRVEGGREALIELLNRLGSAS